MRTFAVPKGIYTAWSEGNIPPGKVGTVVPHMHTRQNYQLMEEKKATETPVLNAHNKEEHRPSHTCEHIVNQTMIRLFGCGRSVSAHIERKKSKLDYRLNHRPTDEEVKRLEDAVNEVIARHLPVTTEYITQEEARGRFDLARLPEDASETVRVVHVGDYVE